MTSHNLPAPAVTAAPGRRAWLIRLPKSAATEEAAIATGIVTFDAGVREDLSGHFEREEILDEVMRANPGEKLSRIESLAGQLQLLLNDAQPGDLAICPLRRSGQVGIGQFLPGYEEDPDGRPARRLRWIRTDIPREAFLPDLIHSFGALQHVCELSRNDAARRIEEVLRNGRDPGPSGAARSVLPEDPNEIERLLRNRTLQRMGAVFAGHGLARLVAEILKAKGYRTRLSPPGPDGGVDILAGKGDLGMDDRLVVQVKSGDIVSDSATLQQLEGAMRATKASRGLLVSWGGFARPVLARHAELWFEIRLWGAEDVLEAFLETRDRLPADIRDGLPMRQVWLL
ncbi:restriction endonuclease [Defluviimonas salinarum]|uniref:Restriction endonuclease n=1 Tax=Defluviimonas salinarum TaxID=2992147 RepID=A0ABT3J4A6_9RHOB|nr:restriction endonuclease [Defluviimonas salinarum]MCW3782501.1 restriction endonuclease [Defluviimonas salinarum]